MPAGESNGEGPNGVTLVDNTLYGNTNTQAFALQASTGEQLWKSSALGRRQRRAFNGQGLNIAPQVVDGKVFLSDSGEPARRDRVCAGREVPARSCGSSRRPRKRPSGRPAVHDGTGGAWGTPVVENGLVYFGIANPYRSLDQATKTPNTVLYNDSTVALNENTGKLKWYYQGVPNDFYDWDMQIGPMYTATGPGGQPTVIDAGKMGYRLRDERDDGQARLEDAGRQAQRARQRRSAWAGAQAPRQAPVHVAVRVSTVASRRRWRWRAAWCTPRPTTCARRKSTRRLPSVAPEGPRVSRRARAISRR